MFLHSDSCLRSVAHWVKALYENRKSSGSNPTECSAGHYDRSSRLAVTFGQTWIYIIYIYIYIYYFVFWVDKMADVSDTTVNSDIFVDDIKTAAIAIKE